MKKVIIKNKLISFFMAFLIMMSIAIVNPMSVSANWEEYVEVTKHDSYSKNKKYYMCFTTKNVNWAQPLNVWAKVFDSAGREVFTWGTKTYKPDEIDRRDYGADYNHLLTGKYTFKLFCSTYTDTWFWSYKINHTRKESFEITAYEKIILDGKPTNKWSIQCTNLKDQKLTVKIFDSKDNLVYSTTGPARKTNDEVGWFTWSGNTNVGKKYKCSSGTYLVQITASTSNKIIEKEYKLKIN